MKHDTLLDGLKLDATARSEVIAPSLLRYDLDRDLVKAFLDDLRAPDWMDRLKARADLPTRFDLPLVDQHLHRKAVLVIVDAFCLTPGFPRLDTAKVPQAGLVIRREDPDDGAQVWATGPDGVPLGWLAAPAGATAPRSDFEPDAALRRTRMTGKNRALSFKTQLTGDADGVSETAHKLFPIPADIAKKIGRTIYFAVLPTTSMAVQPADAPPPPFATDDVAARVPNMLQIEPDADLLPDTDATITRAAFRAATDPAIAALKSTLTWLGQENGLFTGAASADPLRAVLNAIPIAGLAQNTLLEWLDTANAILVEDRSPADGTVVSYLDRTAGPGSIQTPDAWPAISQATFDAITAAGFAAMAARWSTLSPTVTRFGPIGDRYHVRCFARLDDCPGCPPRMLWSPLSRSYTIRPWYESGGAAPQQIQLPSLSDLSNVKPDVAVNVPPEIQQFMDKLNIESLMDGEAPKSGLSFGMICGFSIPIITICAFIILQIFLQLLNIIFFWLPFVKICIPYPKIDIPEDTP